MSTQRTRPAGEPWRASVGLTISGRDPSTAGDNKRRFGRPGRAGGRSGIARRHPVRVAGSGQHAGAGRRVRAAAPTAWRSFPPALRCAFGTPGRGCL